MNSSDSAEELVKIYLDGVEQVLKISGVGAKNLAVALIAMAKSKEQTRGKTRLTNMLKTGKPLKIFTIRADELKKFSQEAKKYGILYCALADKKNSKIDGMVDIMVREEDAARINRIAERFNFRDVATVKKEHEKQKENLQENVEVPKSESEQFIDEIMPKPKEEIPSNDTQEAEEKNPSEISLNTKSNDKVEISDKKEEKKSVIQELKEIEQDQKAKEQQEITADNIITKEKKKGGKHYKEKGEKNKGKRYKEPKHLATNSKNKKLKNKERGK